MASYAKTTSETPKRINFDYQETREVYMNELAELYKDNYNSVLSGESTEIACDQTVNALINIIKSRRSVGDIDESNEILSNLANFFLVEIKPWKDTLLRPKADSRLMNHIQVLGYETAFDVLYKAHLKYDHCDVETLEIKLSKKYEIPSKCYEIFPEFCYICRNKNPSFNKNVEALIINFPVPEENFSLILLYRDTWTDYHLLRPLSSDSHEEIAMELLKIFSDFGIPKMMYVTVLQRSLFRESLKKINGFMPCSVIINTMSNNEGNRNSNKIVDLMIKWMEDSSNSDWAYGCYEVQMKLNETSNCNAPKDSPYVKVFGELNLQKDEDYFETHPTIEENTIPFVDLTDD